MMEAILLKAMDQSSDDVIGVRPEAKDRVDGRDAGLFAGAVGVAWLAA
jgi:hypothetical protein